MAMHPSETDMAMVIHLSQTVIATSYCHWHVVFSDDHLYETSVMFTNSPQCDAQQDCRRMQTALKT
jgi:hypothetical protein